MKGNGIKARDSQKRISPSSTRHKFIDGKTADCIADYIVSALGPHVAQALKKYNFNVSDFLRFRQVSEMCQRERERKGLTIKQIAEHLKVPQYRLKDVEDGGIKRIIVPVLENYVDYLDMRRWFHAWKKQNSNIYKGLSRR